MIQTIIDMLNSILDYASIDKKNYIYEIVGTKFYQKLQILYANPDIIKRLKDENIKNLPQYEKVIKSDPIQQIKLLEFYKEIKFENIEYNRYNSAKKDPYGFPLKMEDLEISNITHCKTGRFHKWKTEIRLKDPLTKQYEISIIHPISCKRCGLFLKDIIYDENLTPEIREKSMIRYLEKICDLYCVNGKFHRFERKEDNGNEVCVLCQYVRGKYLPPKDMRKLETLITNPKIFRKYLIDEKKKKKHDEFISSIIKKLKSYYSESKTHRDDYYKFIEKFVDLLQKDVGDFIRLENDTIYLKEDMYIINHNHLGFPIEPPIRISEKSGLIMFKNNHQTFKTDVIIYNSGRSPKIDIFYDLKTNILLGYKELNKDFVINKRTANRIQIEYSLINQIKYLGNQNRFIDSSKYKEDIIGEISRERIENL